MARLKQNKDISRWLYIYSMVGPTSVYMRCGNDCIYNYENNSKTLPCGMENTSHQNLSRYLCQFLVKRNTRTFLIEKSG